MPVTPSRSCFSAGTLTLGVKKKYSVLPSGMTNGESSPPAVFIAEDNGIGVIHSVEWRMEGRTSASGVSFIAPSGMALSLVLAGLCSVDPGELKGNYRHNYDADRNKTKDQFRYCS